MSRRYRAARHRAGERAYPGWSGQKGATQHGIILTTGNPREASDLAAAAEAAGWDAVFTYGAIAISDEDLYDPWITVAAMAIRTERVRLGAYVLAPARRRPSSRPGRHGRGHSGVVP